MQREIDSPLQYIYGFKSQGFTPNNFRVKRFNSVIDLPDQVKAVYLPQEDGSIFVRFQNILDLISADESATINVEDIADRFSQLLMTKVKKVYEVSNSGLYTMDEMKQLKMKWKGLDYTSPDVDYSSDPSNVELTPQRIRSFVLEFESATKDTLVSA